MALSNDPVFPQTPKTAGIEFAEGTEDTSLVPASVSPTTLMTAGTDGALVTSIKYFGTETPTAQKVVLWIQHLGTGDWHMLDSKVQAAYTMATTTAQDPVVFVDKADPDNAIRLQGTDKLGITHQVDLIGQATCEYLDY